ncbi:alpha/beta fold hydrolase [Aquabacterium sp. OR-4]|uniref:alpha/beta fold hydrolase n=1 Tax=Aquabacterium sp. OR-4 TaxID=2978127 RepID=UPI0021B358D1|nr:alpha/beta hydrolase [Aquabacterium sp. OR-4]MDT7836427.1 alpha/beta hydrolase [Aquabacterium sp. OR-4]
MNAPATATPYLALRQARSRFVPVRGLQVHLLQWGEPQHGVPLRVMAHGYMDVGASFQFVVDALHALGDEACVIAPDWRGFGRTLAPPGTDAYWFADYLGDLDGLLDALSPDAPVDLIGHSMGGNVAMAYAGVRPQRIRRLVNLEGFGLPDLPAEQAPGRLAQWLDELKTPQHLKPYASLAEVAQRLRHNNPRLPAGRAEWLAAHWAEAQADGQWVLRADAAHRRVNPVPYRAADAIATWRAITAPTLWVQGAESAPDRYWNGRYTLAEFQQRLAQVRDVRQQQLPDAGHMLHHDQPQALAAVMADFLR